MALWHICIFVFVFVWPYGTFVYDTLNDLALKQRRKANRKAPFQITLKFRESIVVLLCLILSL